MEPQGPGPFCKMPLTKRGVSFFAECIVGVIPKEGLVRPRLPNPRYPMTMTKILQDVYLWHTPHNYKSIMPVDCIVQNIGSDFFIHEQSPCILFGKWFYQSLI